MDEGYKGKDKLAVGHTCATKRNRDMARSRALNINVYLLKSQKKEEDEIDREMRER